MFFSDNPRKAEQVKISINGAYTLWRSLIDRYVFIDHFNHLKNFIHDRDFTIYLNRIIDGFKDEAEEIEKLCQEYGITSPLPNTKDQNVQGNSEIVKDKEVAEVLYRFLRLDLNILLLGLKGYFSNDEVKEFLMKLLKHEINRLDKFIRYMKVKNWIEAPPLYPYIDPKVKEKVAINEVFLLFDHLMHRYSNIRQTRYYAATAADTDLKALFELGIKVLEKEIRQLEDILLEFGITLPNPNPVHVTTFESKEEVDDRFLYNMVFRGMQDTMVLHGTAISEIVINDNLRKFFIDLSMSELFMLDKMDKYGKLKGWSYMTPSYRGGTKN